MSGARVRTGRRGADKIGHSFTQVYNRAIRDARLSRRARGLLVELMSHAEGFTTSVATLVKQGPEGRDAIMSALKELEKYGYLERVRVKGEDGRFTGVEYVVTDIPGDLEIAEKPRSEPLTDLPSVDEPAGQAHDTGNQATGNQATDFQGLARGTHKKTTFEEDQAFVAREREKPQEDHLLQESPEASPSPSPEAPADGASGAEEEETASPKKDTPLPLAARKALAMAARLRAERKAREAAQGLAGEPTGPQSGKAPSRPADGPQRAREDVPGPRAHPDAVRLLTALPRVGEKTAAKLAPMAAEAMRRGWKPQALLAHLRKEWDPERIKSPEAVLRTRLADLPPVRTPGAPGGIPWCGECNDGREPVPGQSRVIPDPGNPRSVLPCPRCHPRMVGPLRG